MYPFDSIPRVYLCTAGAAQGLYMAVDPIEGPGGMALISFSGPFRLSPGDVVIDSFVITSDDADSLTLLESLAPRVVPESNIPYIRAALFPEYLQPVDGMPRPDNRAPFGRFASSPELLSRLRFITSNGLDPELLGPTAQNADEAAKWVERSSREITVLIETLAAAGLSLAIESIRASIDSVPPESPRSELMW